MNDPVINVTFVADPLGRWLPDRKLCAWMSVPGGRCEATVMVTPDLIGQPEVLRLVVNQLAKDVARVAEVEHWTVATEGDMTEVLASLT